VILDVLEDVADRSRARLADIEAVVGVACRDSLEVPNRLGSIFVGGETTTTRVSAIIVKFLLEMKSLDGFADIEAVLSHGRPGLGGHEIF
jgi:hypothetical protein